MKSVDHMVIEYWSSLQIYRPNDFCSTINHMYRTKLPYMQSYTSIRPLGTILWHFLREFAHFALPLINIKSIESPRQSLFELEICWHSSKIFVDRDIELFQIYLLKIKTFDVYSIDVSSLLRYGIGRAAIYVTILTRILKWKFYVYKIFVLSVAEILVRCFFNVLCPCLGLGQGLGCGP